MIRRLSSKTRLPQTSRLVFGSFPHIAKELDYDDYWSSKRRGKWQLSDFQRERLESVASEIQNGWSLFDIGAGDPSVLDFLKNEVHPSSITAVDISKSVVSALRSHGYSALLLDVEDADSIKKLPKADVILALEILEHTRNPESILDAFVVKARKKVIFSVPNTGFIGHRLRLLFGSFPLQWRRHPSEHLRFWTMRDMRWWLKELGHSSKSKIIAYEGIPFLKRVWPSMFAMGMIVVLDVSRKN
jgi:2-polyprenyl-3-methyl-5-hydroxy-6-metoxy-1,4-benzoquinol methylase